MKSSAVHAFAILRIVPREVETIDVGRRIMQQYRSVDPSTKALETERYENSHHCWFPQTLVMLVAAY